MTSSLSDEEIIAQHKKYNKNIENENDVNNNKEKNYILRKFFLIISLTSIISIIFYMAIESIIIKKNLSLIKNFRNFNLKNFKVDDKFLFGLFMFFLSKNFFINSY